MYQALYRKYRSKTFDELLGQDQVTIPLKNQIIQGEVSHAYLFSGTRGTGKTSAAKIFARGVNCLHPVDGNPCNECENCKLILEDRMMDVVEMDAASNNGVDDIRELKERVVYPPGIGKYKVYIIDEVHMLSKGAFNALLKVLEEPPKHLIFILATTELEKIPATIRSRCQRFQFRRLSRKTLVQGMEGVLKAEGKSADPEALDLIARHSQGAMRDALSLLEQCLFMDQHLSLDQVQKSLGLVEEDILDQLLKILIQERDFSFIPRLNQAYTDGRDLERLLMDLLYKMKDCIVSLQGGGPQEKAQGYLEDFHLRDWLEAMHALEETLKNLRYSKDPLLTMEIGFMDAYLAFSGQAQGAASRVKKDPTKAFDMGQEVKKAPPLREEAALLEDSAPEPEAPSFHKEEKPVSQDQGPGPSPKKPEDFKEAGEDGIIEKKSSAQGQEIDLDLFDEARDYCKDQGKISVYAMLKDARAFQSKGLVNLVFGPNFQFHVKNLSSKENLSLVQEAFSKVLQEEVSVKISLEEEAEEEKKDPVEDLVDFFGNDLLEKK